MQDLLLQSPSLFIAEVAHGRESVGHPVVLLGWKVVTFGVFERTGKLAELALRFLDGAPQSVEGLPRLGLC